MITTSGAAGDDALPDSTIYDRKYFLSSACEGLRDYLAGGLASVKSKEVDYLELRGGLTVLDLGCGRGESAAEVRRRGCVPVAMDYSADAVELAKELLGPSGMVVRADASNLPFRPDVFDRVLMGDVIEHLPWDIAVGALGEVSRVLRPGGQALVHTSPNTWFITLVKRPLELLMRALRRREVLARFAEYDRLRAAMHPNELNPRRISTLMKAAGVHARTWVDRDVMRSGQSEWTEQLSGNRAVRVIASIAGLWPLRLILGNDLFALIEKGPRREA